MKFCVICGDEVDNLKICSDCGRPACEDCVSIDIDGEYSCLDCVKQQKVPDIGEISDF